ncbi:MAG: VOC family protein [Polyangiaceae bacterium]
MRAQPLIAVSDVEASAIWYSRLLSIDALGHGGGYEQLSSGGQLILQLHAWDEEDHPNLSNEDSDPIGLGVLIWFQTDDFEGVVKRAKELHAEVVEEPHVNPNSKLREIWLRDLDGYVVVVSSE